MLYLKHLDDHKSEKDLGVGSSGDNARSLAPTEGTEMIDSLLVIIPLFPAALSRFNILFCDT
jgi:hypothetical protein